jgi:hypothetical protein
VAVRDSKKRGVIWGVLDEQLSMNGRWCGWVGVCVGGHSQVQVAHGLGGRRYTH